MALIIISVGAGSEPAPTDNDSPPFEKGGQGGFKGISSFSILESSSACDADHQ